MAGMPKAPVTPKAPLGAKTGTAKLAGGTAKAAGPNRAGPSPNKALAGRPAKADSIIDAAAELFLRQGYGNTGMDAVAKVAGVSKATIYAHFRSKEELLSAIISAESRAQDWGSLLLDDGEPRCTLTRYCGHVLRFLLNPRSVAMLRLVMAETHNFPEVGRAVLQAGPLAQRERLIAYFRRMTQRGKLRVADPELATSQFIGLLKGDLQTRYMLDPSHVPSDADIDRQVHGAVDLFLGAYGAAAGRDLSISPPM